MHSNRLTVPQSRKQAKEIAKESNAIEIAKEYLQTADSGKRRIGINILLALKNTPKKMLEKAIRSLGNDADWKLREEAAMVTRTLLERNFDLWFPFIRELVQNTNVNLKRAAVVGSMASKIKDKTNIRKLAEEIFEPCLTLSDPYIRKNLGPFAIGSFLVRNHPDVAFYYLDKWVKSNNEWARWNVIMTFSQSAGKKYPKEAKAYIKIVGNDLRKPVQNAIKSVSRYVGILKS